MDDRSHIENLIYEYTYRLDGGDFAAVGELFADGDWVLPAETDFGEGGLVLHGADRVREWLHANIWVYGGSPMTNHVTTNVAIELGEGGETASARSYLTVFQGVPPDFPLQVIFCGRYLDEFARTDGAWRFTRRAIVAASVGDMSAHVRST